MIIRAKGLKEGLNKIEYDKDKIKLVHVQKIEPYLKQCYLEREYREVNKKSDFRKIASIPDLEFIRHPEFMYDSKALIKWLKSDEGKQFKTTRENL